MKPLDPEFCYNMMHKTSDLFDSKAPEFDANVELMMTSLGNLRKRDRLSGNSPLGLAIESSCLSTALEKVSKV